MVVLAVVVALITLIVVLVAQLVMVNAEPTADAVLDARQIAASKVRSSYTETSQHLVEERGAGVSDLFGAVKDF